MSFAISQVTNTYKEILDILDRSVGLVVSVIAFYPDDLSSKPAEA